MIRLLYATIYTSLLPIIFLQYLIRSKNNPDYRHNFLERLALKLPKLESNKRIHIHLVSVGEANAASTLVIKLLNAHPQSDFLITVTTPTGRARVNTLFSQYNNITIAYLPFDIAWLMERFIRKVQPTISIILETEMWPYFLLFAKRANVPVVLINARLSKKSLKGYLKLGQTSIEMFTSLDLILAQYKPDKKRLLKLGCLEQKVKTIGNIKFDIQVPSKQVDEGKLLKQKLNRPIWVATSTHPGEEEFIFAAHKKVLESQPNTLLIIVPRHTERFEQVLQLSQSSFDTINRKGGGKIEANHQVFVGDTMGEMFFYLAMADINFIGGSLIKKLGGHNPIEPAVIGLPIITGSHVANFKTVYKECTQKKFCIKLEQPDELPDRLLELFHSVELRHKMAKKAIKYVASNQGVCIKMLEYLELYLQQGASNAKTTIHYSKAEPN